MDIADLISNIGFPMAVTFYLLMRVESKLELLTNSINELARVLLSQKEERANK